jgi:hypothetical protein
MLITAPLAVTYSYAEDEENLESEDSPKDSKLRNQSKEMRLGAILTEKVVNGKLELKQFSLPENTTTEDMNRIISLEGTSGWSYVNYKAYHSGIVLFDGKVSKDGEKFWRISINGSMNLTKGESDLQSRGNLNNSSPGIGKNFSSEDLNFKVIFSGKMIESDKENIFAIASMNPSQCPETSQNIKLLQFGNPTSDSVNSIDCNQKVRISVLVE